MRIRTALFVLCLLTTTALAQQTQVLWYSRPAAVWTEALPIGNGRLGAMVFGGANTLPNNGDREEFKDNALLTDGSHTRGQDEHLQLNEESVWDGDGLPHFNPAAHDAFIASRKLLLDSNGVDPAKISAAEKVAADGIISGRMPGYVSLGDLYLRSTNPAPITDYQRQLDLATGTVRITYTQSGIHYTREIFASHPSQIIAIRVTADKPASISFTASMDRLSDFAASTYGNNHLTLRQGPEHEGIIHFLADTVALPTRGSIHATPTGLIVEDADSVTILIAMGTDFKGGPFPGGDPAPRLAAQLEAAQGLGFDALHAAAAADHASLFNRMSLQLGPATDPNANIPTDVRLKRVSAGADDLGLLALYFDFARYLSIGSSRDALPSNLQGLWAGMDSNPWGSKFTINVNTEMNYWLAEPAGLGDTVTPLFNLLDLARTTGTATTAQTYYDARGFVLHHNTDVYGDARPIDGISSGLWPMGGAWLTLQAWDHYAFTGDKTFLADRAWPLLEGASQFFLDYLTPDHDGHLVTGPSLSPENRYKLPDHSVHHLVMGPTMDIEILRELFNRTLEAGEILHKDPAFLKQVSADLRRLPPYRIGKFGNIQEWPIDYEEAEPGHRHISHLWALFPGTQITPAQPQLYKAARITLQRRLDNGGGQTGWSRAWVVNYWDHLHDGDQAYDSLQVLFRQSTFLNLMDTHPAARFQIDGNLGAANGMLEALAQSYYQPDGHIDLELLPALPHAWPQGTVTGLRVRGGGILNMVWQKGMPTTATLHATHDQAFSLTVDSSNLRLKEDSHFARALTIHAKAGHNYTLLIQPTR